MARRLIVKMGDDILRKRSKEVTEFDDNLRTLIKDMKETMIFADGVGLAAPQVGVLKRVAVVSADGRNFYEFVNPIVINSSGKQLCREGCLSVPGISGEVERPKTIEVLAFDGNGSRFDFKAEGFLADICYHEFDHLDGVLFVDKMIPDKR